MLSTNPLPVSNATCGRKGKACASTPSKLPTTSAPSPKKQGGRKVGARAWTIKDYLLVFRIISVVRPASSDQWEIVCKNCWVKVLKLPKPTGQSKMHPLHCLALAVNKSISKSHAIGLLDDSSAQDEYKETEIKFKRAETQMKRLRLDFKHAPNFEVPLLNEDAKVKDNGANSNTKNANNNCAGNKAGPDGDLSESWAGLDDKAAGEGAGSGAGEDLILFVIFWPYSIVTRYLYLEKTISNINHVLVGRINNLEEHIARIEEPGLVQTIAHIKHHKSFAERLNTIYEADLQEQRNLIANLENNNRSLALTNEEQERLIEEKDRLLVEKELELDNFHCSIQDITQDGKGRIHYYKEYEFFAVSHDNAWFGQDGRD
ncbi:hypothetical protein RhiXN_05235 [Rhizoctonia solani]|uniref:Uncharacterized protein n=1 Tax=Rhizoctonia solani TaxID=456999 RepID=A0A8H8SUL8_9AGAM|nr:uncharacterized protein RhiXN_05235 [Rhizoctonia solani]QRW17233.1 hypothetical protein RhiXN_05235 [Rhizoctonia solani]